MNHPFFFFYLERTHQWDFTMCGILYRVVENMLQTMIQVLVASESFRFLISLDCKLTF